MHLREGLLYGILDSEVIKLNGLDIYDLGDRLSRYGVDILQFRFKNISDKLAFNIAQELAKIIHKRRKIFVVNDRVDIAYFSGADGVHLGSDDLDVFWARKLLGKKRIIGKTVHSEEEFKKAKKESVDYLSLGPVFKTEGKPDLALWSLEDIKDLLKKTKKVIFAIGGINLDNLGLILSQGLKNIAVCRGLILSKNLKSTIRAYKESLKTAC
jgi:thiamine-phosphate pyrophosphorylase